jgi:hypothetical protein
LGQRTKRGIINIKRSTLSVQQWIVLLIVNAFLIAGLAVFNASTLIPARGLRFDFYPHWVGGRALWNGQTPYTSEITRQVQEGMFDGELPLGADQQNMAYPAYSAVLLAPVIAFPAQTAIALWMAVGLVSVIWTPVIWLAILGWKPSPILLFFMILGFTFGFHYAMDMLILAQFSGVVLLACSLGVWLLVGKRDILAGVIFAFATVPPTIGALLAGFILGAYALRGRWRGLAAFVISMLILVGVSVLRIGWWIPDWLRVVGEYAAYAPPVWPPNFLPLPVRILLVSGAIALVGFALIRFLRGYGTGKDVEIDLAVWALLGALFLLPQTGYYYLVLLIPVIITCLHRARALPIARRRLIWFSCLLAVASPWLYFSIPAFNPDVQSLILPLHIGLTWLAVNYWSRSHRGIPLPYTARSLQT